MARLPQNSRVDVRGVVWRRVVAWWQGGYNQAPATVGEELLQHLIVHLEEFDRGVGERVGKLKRR